MSTTPRGGGGDNDLRRLGGGALSGDRERDLPRSQHTRTASEVRKTHTSFFSETGYLQKVGGSLQRQTFMALSSLSKSRRETRDQLGLLTNGPSGLSARETHPEFRTSSHRTLHGEA